MSDMEILNSSERSSHLQSRVRYIPHLNVYRKLRLYSNKQLLRSIHEFSKAALSEQTNPLREQAVREYPINSARMHRIRKKDGAIDNSSIMFCITAVTKLKQFFEISIPLSLEQIGEKA